MAGKVRWETACLLANLGLLGAVVWAFHLGLDAHRLRTAAIFLILGTASSLYGELVFHACKVRARRQRERDVPRGVRLRMPLWLAAGGPLAMLLLLARRSPRWPAVLARGKPASASCSRWRR